MRVLVGMSASRFLGQVAGVVFGLWVVWTAVAWSSHLPAFLLAGVGIGLGVWRWRSPGTFRVYVVQVVAGVWFSWRYRWWWKTAMSAVGLDGVIGSRDVYPPRWRFRSTRAVDRFRVRMLPGQVLEDWAASAEALANVFGVEHVRFARAEGHLVARRDVDVTALRRDVLMEPVTPWPAESVPDLTGLPIALAEDGTRWRMPLLGRHVLIGGATGAGKGSVLWSIITHLAPAVSAGTVRLMGLDPKAVEFAFAPDVFHTIADGDPETLTNLLEDLVQVMDARKTSMRGVTRLHTPTVDEPMIVVIIDELAALTAYAPPPLTKRINSALALLLTQGRAMAISVIAAAQDPRKETLSSRDLFTDRIGMRFNDPGATDMLLGQGARARGAVCDQISPSTPGVAWVVRDGSPIPIRVRFPWSDDNTVRDLGKSVPDDDTLRKIVYGS